MRAPAADGMAWGRGGGGRGLATLKVYLSGYVPPGRFQGISRYLSQGISPKVSLPRQDTIPSAGRLRARGVSCLQHNAKPPQLPQAGDGSMFFRGAV